MIRGSGLFIFFLLWEFAPRIGWADAQFIPPLSVVLTAGYKLWTQGVLYSQLIVSLWRAVLGLLLAITVALPAGIILGGWFPVALKYLDPLFRLLSNVNPFSLAPVFLLFFGIGETMKIMIIALVAVWPILFHTITGIRTVDPLLIKTARSMNVSEYVLMREILLPAAFPTIITGVRIGVQMAVFMLIAAEMLGAKAGLGWLVHASAMLFQIPRMYAGGLFIILLGMFINQIILHIEKNSSFWKESVEIFDIASPMQVKKISIKNQNRYYIPAVAGLIVLILIFGGREVNLVNSARMNNSSSPRAHIEEHSTHNHHDPGHEMKDEQSKQELEVQDKDENIGNYSSGE
jgi:NitT/TauT family transport system permease protein